jgi:hypothetical protein
MTAPTTPDVDLERALIAQILPPCEAATLPCGCGRRHECDAPADWIIGGVCSCGLAEHRLLCDEHADTIPVIFQCLRCGVIVPTTKARL